MRKSGQSPDGVDDQLLAGRSPAEEWRRRRRRRSCVTSLAALALAAVDVDVGILPRGVLEGGGDGERRNKRNEKHWAKTNLISVPNELKRKKNLLF